MIPNIKYYNKKDEDILQEIDFAHIKNKEFYISNSQLNDISHNFISMLFDK